MIRRRHPRVLLSGVHQYLMDPRLRHAGMTVFILLSLSSSFAFDLSDLDLNKVASGGSKLIKAAAGLSDEDEAKIGRDVAAHLAARYGLVQDPKKIRYVNLVGLAVVRHSSRADIPYTFGILKSSEVNALAAPGGYIFITEGLLDFVKDEAELAGVLAHEVSHVTQKHIVKAIRQANLLGAGEDLATAANKDAAAFGKLSDFSINLLSKGLSRDDELEADTLGTVLAGQTGYDPTGLRDCVKRLGEIKADPSVLEHFNKTHPSAKDRLGVIDTTLKKNKLTASGPRLAERFAAAAAQH